MGHQQKVKKKEESILRGDANTYMKAQAYMCNIPSAEFMTMPIGELSDIIDAINILNGYCDEVVHNDIEDDNCIPDLR